MRPPQSRKIVGRDLELRIKQRTVNIGCDQANGIGLRQEWASGFSFRASTVPIGIRHSFIVTYACRLPRGAATSAPSSARTAQLRSKSRSPKAKARSPCYISHSMGSLFFFLHGWGFLLQAVAIVHFIRRRPDTYWIFIILFLGWIGALIYIAAEVVPDAGLRSA